MICTHGLYKSLLSKELEIVMVVWCRMRVFPWRLFFNRHMSKTHIVYISGGRRVKHCFYISLIPHSFNCYLCLFKTYIPDNSV